MPKILDCFAAVWVQWSIFDRQLHSLAIVFILGSTSPNITPPCPISHHCLISRNHVFFHHFEKKQHLWSFNPLYFWNYIQGSGIVFCVSYIHSKTMLVVPIERACQTIAKYLTSTNRLLEKSQHDVNQVSDIMVSIHYVICSK